MVDSLKGLFGGGEQEQPGMGVAGDRAGRREERAARRSLRHDPEMRQRAQDFHSRYTTGDPSQGYDAREAWDMYQHARQEATPEQMQRAMEKTVTQMTPSQRAQFAQMLEERQRGQGMTDIPRRSDTADPGPGGLLGMLHGFLGGGQPSRADEPEGGMLGSLFGGDSGAARPPRRDQTAQGQPEDQGSIFPGFLDNPLAKVLVGGIAAYAAKEIADQHRQ